MPIWNHMNVYGGMAMLQRFTRGRRLLALSLCACLAVAIPAASAENDWDINQTLEARLSDLGFFSEVPDENADEATRIALANFQTANDLEATGELDKQTRRRLGDEECVSKTAYLTGLSDRYREAELAEGAYGDAVAAVQEALIRLGYYEGRADGAYGEATSQAVALFQLAAGLNVTGIADGATLYRLLEGEMPTRADFLASRCAVKGDSGNRVKLAQQRLKRIGYFSGDCTGTYGDLTQEAVAQFQRANGLAGSGVLDLETCGLLYSLDIKTAPTRSLRPGDSGEDIRALQKDLTELGYYTGELNGVYDTGTQTALCLYDIANGRGAADGVDPSGGVPRAEADAAFRESRSEANAEAGQRAANTAEQMLGQTFDAGSANARFAGFSFIQSIFAQNGVAFWEPGEILGEAKQNLSSTDEPARGSIVVLAEDANDGARLQLTLSLGGGRLALLDETGHYVISEEMDEAQYAHTYVWVPGERHEQTR